MFAGHLGAGLLIKRIEPRAGLGTLLLSSLLLDVILWILILLGIEKIRVPADFTRMADLEFDFPYSHGLPMAIGWSIVWSFAGKAVIRGLTWRGAFAIGGAVLSHFALDWLVHARDLPLAGPHSRMLGLGLWRDHLPLAWVLESALVFAGLGFYLRAANLSLPRALALLGMLGAVTLATMLGQAQKGPVPPPPAMALSSLMSILLLTVFGWWLEKSRREPKGPAPTSPSRPQLPEREARA